MGVKITENLLLAVINNHEHCEEIMDLLFDKYDPEIRITPSLMQELVLSFNIDAVIALLKKRMKEIMLNEECVEVFAKGRKDAMELLLQERGEEVQVTQEVLVTAARYVCDLQTVRLLLNKRDPGTDINKEVLFAYAGNTSKAKEIMDVLLDECGQDTVIDDEIIQKIARNRDEGLVMMKALICRQQAGFAVTEQILCDTAHYHGREMLELLLNNAGGSGLPITGNICWSLLWLAALGCT